MVWIWGGEGLEELGDGGSEVKNKDQCKWKNHCLVWEINSRQKLYLGVYIQTSKRQLVIVKI